MEQRYGLPALLVFGILLGGCKVGPDFVPPEATVHERWLDGDDPALREEPLEFDEWWSVFEDPVLDELIRTAYANNLSLRIAGLRVLEARARRGIAAGLFFPQIQRVSASAAAVSLSDNDPNLAVLDRDFNEYSLSADALWELDFWGKFRRGIESADAALLASVDSYDTVLVSLVGEVASSYVLSRAFEERLALARANVELQARTLEIAEVRFRNGAVTELDVTQARANLAVTEALIPVLADGLRQTRITLSVLLGMPPSELADVLAPGRIPEAPAEVAVGIPADLLRRRPDLREAEKVAAALSAQIGVAQADLYPAVRLLGSTGFRTGDSIGSDGRSKDVNDLFDSDSYFGFLRLGFDWPILNYGRIKNNVRVQDARFQQAIVNYENAVLRAAAEVESGLSSYLQARLRAERLADGVTAAERSVELALTQYREGSMDFIRVLAAQTLQVTLQDQDAEARARIALGLVSTYKSLGGGWELRRGQEFVPAEMAETMRERTDWGGVLDPDYSAGSDLGFDRPDPEQ